jgi:hypothetical protein
MKWIKNLFNRICLEIRYRVELRRLDKDNEDPYIYK